MNKYKNHLELKNTLIEIASVLNDNKINWGLGGSLLLLFNGIKTVVEDIDIVIDKSDIPKVERLVKDFNHIDKSKNDIYLTERFYSIRMNEVNIDLMMGFKILTNEGVYKYPEGNKLIDRTVIIDETSINLCSLKDWLEAYTAMNRKNKIELIKQSKLVK